MTLRTFTKQQTDGTHGIKTKASPGEANDAKTSFPLSAAKIGSGRDSSSISQADHSSNNPQRSNADKRRISAIKEVREDTENSNKTDVEEEDEYQDDETFEGDDDDDEPEDERTFILNVPRMISLPAKGAGKGKGGKHQQVEADGHYMHPVRAEPYTKSTVVGYLVSGLEVLSNAECGSWLKVRIHAPENRRNKAVHQSTNLAWGWAMRADAENNYLTALQKTGSRVDPNSKYTLPPIAPNNTVKNEINAADHRDHTTPKDAKTKVDINATPSLDKHLAHRSLADLSMHSTPLSPTPGKPRATDTPSDDEQVQEWSELFDSNGHVYYYNAATFQSQWEPPDWVEECDTATGHK